MIKISYQFGQEDRNRAVDTFEVKSHKVETYSGKSFPHGGPTPLASGLIGRLYPTMLAVLLLEQVRREKRVPAIVHLDLPLTVATKFETYNCLE